MNTIVYKVIEYKVNKNQHRFWLYPTARRKVVSIIDWTEHESKWEWEYHFYTKEEYRVWDIIEFHWSRDYWFWLNNKKDSYIRYRFPLIAKLTEDETYKTYTLY